VIADSDGQNPVTVATSREPLMSPTWSPDRRQLAYVGYERGRSAIYLHTLATGELRKISSERGIKRRAGGSRPTGASSRSRCRSSPTPTSTSATCHGRARQLTRITPSTREATWSPDGREIAFTLDRGGQPQIYTVPASAAKRGAHLRGKQNLCPHYSPDGKKLVLVNSDGVSYRIALLDLATRQLKIIGDGRLMRRPAFRPTRGGAVRGGGPGRAPSWRQSRWTAASASASARRATYAPRRGPA